MNEVGKSIVSNSLRSVPLPPCGEGLGVGGVHGRCRRGLRTSAQPEMPLNTMPFSKLFTPPPAPPRQGEGGSAAKMSPERGSSIGADYGR